MTDRRSNVIVLIFDTLRADALSCYGGTASTPNFDRAADMGTLFERAFSAGPGTPISHAALYTGQYPAENGVTGAYISLPDESPVIAGHFREHGYETFGITGPSKMGSDFDYDRGFDELFEPYYDIGQRKSLDYLKRVITNPLLRNNLMRTIRRGDDSYTELKFDLLQNRINSFTQPFFVLSNFLTVHSPYNPPRPYKEQAVEGYKRPRIPLEEILFNNIGTLDRDDIRLDRIMKAQTATGIGKYIADSDWLTDAELTVLKAWYRAAVEYLDKRLGHFLHYYKRELAEDTILVLTADHGEELGENGLLGHSHRLYDATLHVPLITIGPDIDAGIRRDDLVSLIDVFPTLCLQTGLPTPDTVSGVPMFTEEHRTAVCAEHGVRPNTYQSDPHVSRLSSERLQEFLAGRKCVRTDEYKLVVTSDGKSILYELPEERQVENPPPEVVMELETELSEQLEPEFGNWPPAKSWSDVSASVEDDLRALGYIE
ncbi:sulfatase [Natrialba sp. PRR66]|uniref:sulfatase n=1 Tax=Natrialba sp. PRR66 TaxID=3098146 RepID=UPI002B1E7003|nr:sulfatase [Natrialba sp. PRR66]